MRYSDDGGATYYGPYNMTQDGTTFSYTLTSLPDDDYTVYVRCVDAAMNGSDLQQRNFTIALDTTAPSLLSAAPSMGATNVSVAPATAVLAYSENIAYVATPGNIVITRVSDGASVSFNQTIVNNELRLEYWGGLNYGTTYRITVLSGAITDIVGNPADRVDVIFTTQSAVAPDITSLSIVGLTHTTGNISWSTNVMPDQGYYRYGTSAYAGTWSAPFVPVGNTGVIGLVGLTPNTAYYYQVRFIKDGATVDSIPLPFTTAESGTGISVDSIQMVKSYATADNTYPNGWAWRFNVTVNDMTETNVAMKFAQWVSGTNLLNAGGNMQYSVDNATWTPIVTNATYGANIDVSGIDLNSGLGGRQITLYVQMKVPAGTPGGSYSTSYGIQTTP
jgi:hypothetical protein